MRTAKHNGVVRLHRGDIMSPEKRSALMARIRGKGTKPELAVADVLRAEGILFEEHVRDLPGRPDFVFRAARVAVFVDGDFWHGWRFPQWRNKLSEKWELKINGNRRRDARNHRQLRRMGWKVVRLWEHQVDRDLDACLRRMTRMLGPRIGKRGRCAETAWSDSGEPGKRGS